MGTGLTIGLITAAPFAVGAVLGTIPMPRLIRLLLAASAPAGLIVWLHDTNHGLAQTITASAVVLLISGGWLLGFVAGRWLRRWRTAARTHS